MTYAQALPQPLARSAMLVLPALHNAAERTGVDFSFLFNTARLESSFRPDARAATSSATGLFQFIESTWLSTLRKHGAAHGIHPANREEALQLRRNPAVASLMAAEHAAENATRLRDGLGRNPTATDLYLAHFLGSNGAVRFLQGLAANPAMAAAEMLPAAARANKAIFFRDGAPRSLQGVHDLLARRFSGESRPAPPRPGGMAATRPGSAEGSPHPILERLRHAADGAVDPRRMPDGAVDPRRMPDGAVDPRRAAHAAYLLLAELGV
ncbi:MAG: transglycosylase SLT domain-containing protein [Sandarakinorhabdus sp.]|nr:transglycosylase SLT domain-containing protein [Sandarakinorhabdus sp.]